MKAKKLVCAASLSGLLAVIGPQTAFSASIVVDEDFSFYTGPIESGENIAPGCNPPDPGPDCRWTQLVRNSSAVVTMQDNLLRIQHFAVASPPTIYSSTNTFSPDASTVVTLKINLHDYVGTGTLDFNLSSWGTLGVNAKNIGVGLAPNGQLQVSAQVDGDNNIVGCDVGGARCVYNLENLVEQLGVDGLPNTDDTGEDPYSGGQMEVTAYFSSNGFRITTNTGFDSCSDTEATYGSCTDAPSVGGLIPYSALHGALGFDDLIFGADSRRGNLGLIGSSSTTEYAGYQLFAASGADASTVSSSTTQSATVATTTLSVTNTGSVDQTGGTTTVLQTMTVDAGGNYTLSGGTLDATTIDANGTFDFTGGTLSVDDFQGDLTNAGGTLSPGNSPGLTQISGDYDQQSAGTLLIELAGLHPGSEHDQVQVSGTAFLGGTLDVDLLYGYTPSLGDSFDILLAEVISGTFGTSLLPTLDPGLVWSLQYIVNAIGSTDVVRLSVEQAVPVPGAVWLFGGALGALGWIRRRRQQG